LRSEWSFGSGDSPCVQYLRLELIIV
jgi:hypothetical protein